MHTTQEPCDFSHGGFSESAVLELNRWKKEVEKEPPVVKVIEKKEIVNKAK